jgi:Na+/H+-dicarboxylate symporter
VLLKLENWWNGLLLMGKIIIGIVLGVVLITYYPHIGSVLSDIFVESGIRDDLVDLLEGV